MKNNESNKLFKNNAIINNDCLALNILDKLFCMYQSIKQKF